MRNRLPFRLIVSISLFVILLPQLLSLGIKDQLFATIYSSLGRTPVQNIGSSYLNTEVALCGYVQRCEQVALGNNQHLWEICLFSDIIDYNNTIILYNYDITMTKEADNPFAQLNASDDALFGMSLGSISDDVLTILPMTIWREFENVNCPDLKLCSSSSFPKWEAYRFYAPN